LRVTDHRYTRDRLRFDLALRMIRHEARTCTIRLCTGLTDDRIRKLYRSYIVASPEAATVRRKRGKSPRQVAYFTRNPAAHLEASLLAGIFGTVGLLETCRVSREPQPDLEFGALFCEAFETYQHLWCLSQLSFEHAWFLLLALAQGEELRVARCPVCSGAFVRDALATTPERCPLCRMKRYHRSTRRLLATRTDG
jgi:hypothetical protein